LLVIQNQGALGGGYETPLGFFTAVAALALLAAGCKFTRAAVVVVVVATQMGRRRPSRARQSRQTRWAAGQVAIGSGNSELCWRDPAMERARRARSGRHPRAAEASLERPTLLLLWRELMRFTVAASGYPASVATIMSW